MRSLWAGLALVVALCIGVFAWLASYMAQQNEKTVAHVAELCLEQTGMQIQLHFGTAMDYHQSQLRGIAGRVSAQGVDRERTREALGRLARNAGFERLALYSDDGASDSVLGNPLVVDGIESFLASTAQGEEVFACGTDANGEAFVLLATPATLPMAGDDASSILVAGFPASNLMKELSLDASLTEVYSHIIKSDGSFIVQGGGKQADNYLVELSHGILPDGGNPQVNKEKEGGFDNRTGSLVVNIDGSWCNVFYTALERTNWYLISTLPQSLVSNPVHDLVDKRFFSTLAACGLVVASITAVFFLYFRTARHQMREIERARSEADAANRAKSTFLSSMSHDIRTPMNAIVGLAEVAVESSEDPSLVEDCLRKIRLSSKHLLGLINDVLDMSKIESGKLTLNEGAVSLRETAENVVGIVQPQVKAKSLRFGVFIENIEEESVYCDGIRLNQVLLNLLSNAVKFTPEGGSVTLSICQFPSKYGDGFVLTRFVVHDTGIGMSPEFQERIFESFEREATGTVNRIEGSGLGMAIVKSIIDKMGGSIEVQSTLGKGSKFTVDLDLGRAEDIDVDFALPPWSMLVVDDDVPSCRSTANTLDEMGARAEWTESGRRAVEMVERRHAAGEDYEAVIIDWQMPSMNGIECARRIRERVGRNMPILLISAYDWSEVETEARDAGVDGFLAKPLFKSTLYYGIKCLDDGFDRHAKPDGPSYPQLKGKRVLVAEDQELNWEVARALLEPYGLELEWAVNGLECAERFAASPSGFYDAVLMDVQMPIMDGYEATRSIRTAEHPDARSVPIVAMTANVFAQDVEDALSCGMNAHTSKPIDAREVARILARLLDGKDARNSR